MNKCEICSPDDLHQMLRDHWDGHFLYRGENSADYILRPKFGRFQAIDSKNDWEVERDILTEFKRRAAPMLQHFPETDWEWLALAQHFGLATRLLDWTENPLIAAFFATQGNEYQNRILYVLDQNQLSDNDDSESPFDLEDVVIYRPKHISTRIYAQGGVFTVHPSPANAFEGPYLERWVINSDCVIDINVMLWTYGIHDAFVFPDLDGLARYLNVRFIWGAQ